MIICGLPNEERAQKKIRDTALCIINQKSKGRWPKSAHRQTSNSLWYILSASQRGTLELAGWQGILLPREFASEASAEHGQHTQAVVWGRETGLSAPRLRRWWWLSQVAGGTKASYLVHGKARSDPRAQLLVPLQWEKVWCKQWVFSSRMQRGLESQYLWSIAVPICRCFSESFAVNFRRLDISSRDIYEQKWYNTEQWLSLNNLIFQL